MLGIKKKLYLTIQMQIDKTYPSSGELGSLDLSVVILILLSAGTEILLENS